MPKKQALASFEDRVAERFLEDAEKLADRIAAESGPPPGGEQVSDAKAVELYGQTDQTVDYDAVLAALTTTGLPPEQIQQLQLIKERPDWAELYAQPAPDPQMAAWLATLAEYPYRAGLVLDYSDDPDEQVKRDEQLFRGWQKRLAEQDAMPMPMPQEGPPA